ncbi:hypothetical protein L218DRAFT_963680 [Marasmius fiardii PR-910]|nr:hypothetical protein L218DRAFT_963680 [Marasmius fiardii PR-910]
MATDGSNPTPIRLDQLYFLYWDAPGHIAPKAVPLTHTPHYRFAVAIRDNLGKLQADPASAPQMLDVLAKNSGYKDYVRWETWCFSHVAPNAQAHTVEDFYRNIVEWTQYPAGKAGSKPFDPVISVGPVAATASGAPSDKQPRYIITDGAHRASVVRSISNDPAAVIKAYVGGQYAYDDNMDLTMQWCQAQAAKIPPSTPMQTN